MENTFEKNHYTHMRQRLQTSFNKAVSFYMELVVIISAMTLSKTPGTCMHLPRSPFILSFLPLSFVHLLVHYLAYAFWVLRSLSVSTPPFYLCNVFTFTYGNCNSTSFYFQCNTSYNLNSFFFFFTTNSCQDLFKNILNPFPPFIVLFNLIS